MRPRSGRAASGLGIDAARARARHQVTQDVQPGHEVSAGPAARERQRQTVRGARRVVVRGV